MNTCPKCKKVFAETFSTCPHCNRAGKGCGALVGIGIVGLGAWGLISAISSAPNSSSSNAKWESISGTQQGIFLTMEINAGSIERTTDGASATVIVKLPPNGNLQRITYICRAPATGVPGAAIFNEKVTDLPAGSTGDGIMKRVCFGSLPDGH